MNDAWRLCHLGYYALQTGKLEDGRMVWSDDKQIVRSPMDCAGSIHDVRVLLSSRSDIWSKCWATQTKNAKYIQKFVYQEEEGESSGRTDRDAGTDSVLCTLVFRSSGSNLFSSVHARWWQITTRCGAGRIVTTGDASTMSSLSQGLWLKSRY